MTMRRLIRSNKGLTLLEVLISASILAVSLLAIAAVFPAAMGAMEGAGEERRAYAVAQGMLERIQGTAAFNDTFLYDGQSTAQATPFLTGSAVVDANLTAWKQEIEQVPGSGLPQGVGTITVVTVAGVTPARLATITVTVQWPNQRQIAAVLITQVSET